MPLSADWQAMPPPMMPAPSTATARTGPAPRAIRRAFRATAWSARKIPTSWAAVGVRAIRANPAASMASAASRSRVAPRRMTSMAASGAG